MNDKSSSIGVLENGHPHRARSKDSRDNWSRIRSSPTTRLWFLEPVYQEALAIELSNCAIPFRGEEKFLINYKGCTLEAFYRPDFVCFDEVIVELKALSQLSSLEESQVINYLKVTGYHTALLLNFGSRSLEKRRFVL